MWVGLTACILLSLLKNLTKVPQLAPKPADNQPPAKARGKQKKEVSELPSVLASTRAYFCVEVGNVQVFPKRFRVRAQNPEVTLAFL